jgi:TonB-linked SusC/RagA family outer membrane protein
MNELITKKKCHFILFDDFSMKKRMILMLLSAFFSVFFSENLLAQDAKITYTANDISVASLLKEIERQTGYMFVYNRSQIDLSRKISVNARDLSVSEVLKAAFKGTGVVFSLMNNNIALSVEKKEKTTPQSPGNVRVTGTVADENGEPLPGVTVGVRGSPRGVITDVDGKFAIEVEPSNTLEISFLGYERYTVDVGQQRTFIIQMKPKSNELDEVTVVAFGRQKKQSVVASIETVKAKDLRIASANLTAAFAGKIPGLISYQTTGEPGADNAQFFVRGVTTFGYKKDPLILIDGFEATSDDLARLQPDDVESFSILKDASATVLYGARGANGIIIVTTKTGHEGPVKVSARLDVNVATPSHVNHLVDGVEYMKLYNEARISRNPALGAYYSEQKIQSTLQGRNPMIYPSVDWYDQLFNPYTVNTKANVNISGGGAVATYYVAGGYDHETGLLKVDRRNNFNNNIDINRFHLRTNVILKLTKTTTLDTRLQGRFERYTGPYETASDIYNMVMNSNPVDFPAWYEPDASHRYADHILFGSVYAGNSVKQNPYAELVKGYRDRNENTITAMATLMQDMDFITRNLKFQAKYSVNSWGEYSMRRKYLPYYYDVASYNQVTDGYTLASLNPTGGQAYLGEVEPGREATSHYYFEARLNWDRQFGKHSVSAMTVCLAEEYLLTGGNSKSIFETLPERNLSNSGRVSYDYDSRYFLEFAYGYNGSEKFAGSKRFGFFPSFGAGWLVSNEGFWAPLKNAFSSLKLKFTYGRVGNDAIAGRDGWFFYLSDIVMSDHDKTAYYWGETFSNGSHSYLINRYANPNISWEISEKYNLGLEAAFFRDESLKFQIDFFRDLRSRIYMLRENFPASAGLEAPVSGNVGKVESQGIDGSLDYQHFFSRDFWLTGRANFTYATNRYLELDEKNYPYDYLRHKGHNINQQWGLVAERLFVDQAEIDNSPRQDYGSYLAGDIKYQDINSDGVIDGNDQIPMGYPKVPEIQYGFGLSSGYKKFDFSFFFQGNGRVSFLIDPNSIAPVVGRRNALTVVTENRWSETNPDVHAFWPRLSVDAVDNNTQPSSWWLRDGSFLRLKTVELGYNLPKITKISLQGSRIYLSAENLFHISSFKLWDPELGSNGLGYPLNRRFNIGIQLSF